jgi:hypothetical protein
VKGLRRELEEPSLAAVQRGAIRGTAPTEATLIARLRRESPEHRELYYDNNYDE